MSTPGGIFLLLGANLGDRIQTFRDALKLISEHVGSIVRQSSYYQTEPWGLRDQPAFLNLVVEIDTSQEPEEVLKNILNIEHKLGRIRYERWGARKIDIDLLFYNDVVLDSARLTLPHPRLTERRFTLVPLVEIAPELVHPVFQKTASQLLLECTDHSVVDIISQNNAI